MELDDRHHHVEQPDGRVHDQRREPRRHRHALSVHRHPRRRRRGVHLRRQRALHAEQRVALQHVPAAGQLHEVQQPPLADLRRQPREVQLRERLLPRQAELLRLQLPRRLLHRPERLPGEPEPDDISCHAAPLPGPLHQHPRAGEADSAAAGVVHRRLRAGRVAAEVECDADGRPSDGRAVLRRHGVSQCQRRRADLPRRNRRRGPVPERQAPRSEAALVASPRVQLGRVERPEHAGPRRHGRLHRQAGLRLDLEPDRQHRRADRLHPGRERHDAAVQSQSRLLQAGDGHRRTRGERGTRRVAIRTSSSPRPGAPTSASTTSCRGA